MSAARDGSGYAASFTDGEVCTWDAQGQVQSIRRGTSASALADAKTLVLGFVDGRLEGRNPRSGLRRWARNPELGPIVHMRMERSGPRVAASTGALGVSIIDTRFGRLVRALRGPPAWSAAFSPNGDRVAVGRANGRVELWDTHHWVASQTVRFAAGTVVDVDWSVDGTQIAAATLTGDGAQRVVTLEVYDFKFDELVFRETAPTGPGPTRFRFDHSGDRVIVGNGPGVGRVWSKPGARQIPWPLPSDEPPHQRPFADHPELPALGVSAPLIVLNSVHAASPNGRWWLHAAGPPAVGSAPPAAPPGLTVVDIDTRVSHALAGSASAIGPFTVGDDGRVAARVDGRVQVWGPDGAALARIGVESPARVTLHGERIALTTVDGRLYTGTAERIKSVPNVTDAAVAVFDPAHPTLLAVGGADGTVRIVDLRGTTQRASALYGGAVRALAFSADGHLLAASGPGPTRADGRAPGGVLIVRNQDDAGAAPWRSVADTPPDQISFVGDRVYAHGANAAMVLTEAGLVLDLSVNLVAAGLGPDGVRWADSTGAIRVAALATQPLPAVPEGTRFATSPDRKWSVSVHDDTVTVWDDKPGKQIRVLPATGQAVAQTVYSDAGDRLAVLYADRTVEVYDVATGEALRNLPSSADWVRFDDTGARVWTFAGPREVVATDVATGTVVERVVVPGDGPLRAAADRAFGRYVELSAAAPSGSSAEGWLDTSAVSPRRLTLASDGFRPVAVSPKADRLATIRGASVERRDPGTGKRVGPELIVEGDTPSAAAAWSHDGAVLAVSYSSGLVRIWDLERNRVLAALGADARQLGRIPTRVAAISFDADDEIVTTRDEGGHPRLFEWNLSLESAQVGSGAGPVLPVRGVNDLLVSADGRRLYSAHDDGNGRAWDLNTGLQTQFYWGHAGQVTALASGSNGRLLTASADGTVRSWEAATGIEKSAHNTFGDPVRSLVASADGWRVAAQGDGNVLRSWDIGKGKATRRWATRGPATHLETSLDGASLRAQLDGWWSLDPTTGGVRESAPPGPTPEATVEVHAFAEALGHVVTDAWTPDRRTWISAHADGQIRVWDVERRALRASLIALTDGSWVVDRADGSRYASESLRDGTSPLLYRPPPR